MVTWGLPVLRASVRYRPRIQADPQTDWRNRGIMLKTFREAAICRQRWRQRGALWKLEKTRFAEAADQGGTRSPLLPAVIEGSAGLDPEVDRPSGAATDEPAANLNIESAIQPSSSGANSSQNLGGVSADERVCCLLVLNLVSSTLSCIRRPRPRFRVLDVCGFV